MTSAVQASFAGLGQIWERVNRNDARARRLADRHYSRQTVGAVDFMASGRVLVLLTPCERAVWGTIENNDPAGGRHWRVSIFRNEGAGLSSDLIRHATSRTCAWWRMKYGELPPVPLRTEVDPLRIRNTRNPGWCFICAGWRVVGRTNGARKGRADLLVLEAPQEAT